MNTEKILSLVGECIEKAANDFLAGKPIDYLALQTLKESVGAVHHAMKMIKLESANSNSVEEG